MSIRLSACSVLFLFACSIEPSLGEIESAATPGEDDGCPSWSCGTNSPVMDTVEFYEVNELGALNDERFKLLRIERENAPNDWVAYDADVIDGELYAHSLQNNLPTLHDTAVEGMRLVFEREANQYYLYIDGVEPMELWARVPGSTLPAYTYTYALSWTLAENLNNLERRKVCGVNVHPGDSMPDFMAVLYDDDRIDTESITVYSEDPGWFTIGCAGTALAKQHLLGHTKAAGALLATTTSLDQRTANLKMITADYCGNGHPFTVPDQPLRWNFANGFANTISTGRHHTPIGDMEARWTSAGAVCLNTPRVDHTHPAGIAVFPHGIEPLLAPNAQPVVCADRVNPRPPPCLESASTGHQEFDGAYIISWNH